MRLLISNSWRLALALGLLLPLLGLAAPAHAQYSIITIQDEDWYVLIDGDYLVNAGQTVTVNIPVDVTSVRYVYRCYQLNTQGDSRISPTYETDWQPCRQVASTPYPPPDDVSDVYQIGSYPADWGGDTQAFVINNYHGSISANVRIQLLGLVPEVAPTATPTPTQAPATPFPVTGACIPGNVVTTPTPTQAPRTPTPFSLTPTTPGPTPTFGPTPTPRPPSLNEMARFDGSLSPWTANDQAPQVSWSADIGPGGEPGVAFLPFDDAQTSTTLGQLQPPAIAPSGNLLVFSRANLPTPIRLIADVQYPELMEGRFAYLQVWYWQDGGLGTAPWTYAGHLRVNLAWHTVTMLLTPPAGAPIRAIALRAVVGGDITNPLGFQPLAIPTEGVQVDNLRLVAGPNANDPLTTGLPVCAGTSAGGGAQPLPRLICTITQVTVDVFSACAQPESLLEIGGWISYLWCSVARYFEFLDENQQQLEALRARLRGVSPFGAFDDIIPAFGALRDTVDVVWQASGEADSDFDWSQLFGPARDWTRPPELAQVTPDTSCDIEIPSLNGPTLQSACLVIRVARDNSPVLKVGEWMFNFGGLYVLILYVQRKLMATNS